MRDGVEADDIAFLIKKRAFALPPASLRKELTESFARFALLYVPCIDLAAIPVVQHVNIMEQPADGDVSLLLFNCIMASGAATVAAEHLETAGYRSRQDACREFFNRAKLLYDFDYEKNEAVLIQALMLMAYWYDSPVPFQDSRYWLSMAVSLSYKHHLHRDASTLPLPLSSATAQRFRKQLWWSLYVADQLVSLVMQRLPLLDGQDFDVSMIGAADFDDLQTQASCTKHHGFLSALFIEKAKLSVCINRILSLRFSLGDERGSLQTTPWCAAPDQSRKISATTRFAECHDDLLRWKQSLPPSAKDMLQVNSRVEAGLVAKDAERSLVGQCSLHSLFFRATWTLFHCQAVSRPGRGSAGGDEDWRSSMLTVAEGNLKGIMAGLERRKLQHCLPLAASVELTNRVPIGSAHEEELARDDMAGEDAHVAESTIHGQALQALALSDRNLTQQSHGFAAARLPGSPSDDDLPDLDFNNNASTDTGSPLSLLSAEASHEISYIVGSGDALPDPVWKGADIAWLVESDDEGSAVLTER